MRENKYRGKRIDNGEWLEGYYAYKEATEQHFIMVETLHHHPKYGSYFTDYEVDPETVGQYTGVHDDSEEQEELFDGDIVQIDYDGQKHICKVQYCGSGFMFVADSLPDGYLWLSDFIEFDRKYCWAEGTKKLGNIYENPSLLEVTHE